MRMILAVNDDDLSPEGVVQFFEGDKLVREHSCSGETFLDALSGTIGEALAIAAELNAEDETLGLLNDIHEAAFTRQAHLPTPLHDRLLDWLKKAGRTP